MDRLITLPALAPPPPPGPGGMADTMRRLARIAAALNLPLTEHLLRQAEATFTAELADALREA